MKTVFKHIINLIITIVICIPCFLFFDWVGQKSIFDWLDILLIMIGISATLTITSIILGQKKKESRIKDITDSTTVFILTSTFLYGGFVLLYWIIFSWSEDKALTFVFDWQQNLTLSISLTIYNIINERLKPYHKKNDMKLVVAAECSNLAHAQAVCEMLKNNEIEAIAVDKKSPIYNKVYGNGSQAQVQVCDKDLKKAKELIG